VGKLFCLTVSESIAVLKEYNTVKCSQVSIAYETKIEVLFKNLRVHDVMQTDILEMESNINILVEQRQDFN
jgi:hypothetical protein